MKKQSEASGALARPRARPRLQGEDLPRAAPLFAAQQTDSISVGRRLRVMRAERGLSLRGLAEMSGLNVNTLSLIEHEKSSPSVSTIQQLASVLHVPVTAFFETAVSRNQIIFQKAGRRPRAAFSFGVVEDLGAGLTLRGGQPVLITLSPGTDSGSTPIVHTGFEFAYCLEGHLTYRIDSHQYVLGPGDSLIFEAHLPHQWANLSRRPTRSLLITCPSDDNDHPTERHLLAR